MASKKGSQLPLASSVADNDSVIIVTGTSPTTKKATKSVLLDGVATVAALDAHLANTTNPHATTKAQVGLSSVDNTPDSAKPVSTATQAALDSKAALSHTHMASQVTDFQTGVSANTDVVSSKAAQHTHANKALLDTYTQTETNLADAVAKKHAHANQATLDATTASFTSGKDVKLSGIQDGATANDTDANLKNRANHTGTQAASTISDFNASTDARITAQKGQNGGLASLDGGGKMPSAQLPALAITDTFAVASQAAMLALSAETGDVAVRTDLNKSFILKGSSAATLIEWQELLTPTDAVQSVNGKTGSVTLTTSDVTEGTGKYFTDARVSANTDVMASVTHGARTDNPHNVTKTQVGLANVPNMDATQRANHTGSQTAATISDFQTTVSANTTVAASVTHAARTDNPHGVTKAQVGLANADNTSDANKPVSTAQQTAINLKAIDSTVVHLAGAETVTGAKTFNAGTLLDKGNQVFNVKAFGAFGDGITNDKTAITLAIAAANTLGGGTVFLPKGTYFVGSPLEAKSGVRFLADSPLATILTTTQVEGQHVGIINVTNANNVTIENIGFSIPSGGSTAITSYGHDGLMVRGCDFTGSASNFGGTINLDGNVSGLSTVSFKNTTIENNTFHGIANPGTDKRVIHLYPRGSNTLQNTVIRGNTFRAITGICIDLDAYTSLQDTLVHGNWFYEIKGGGTPGTPGVAVNTKIGGAYEVEGLTVSNNFYRNTLNSTTQSQGLVYFYGCRNIVITGNTAIGAWTTASNIPGPALAPGRTSAPVMNAAITGNTIKGFDAAWDPDSMQSVEVANNIVDSCGSGFNLGYGTQKYVTIHHNTIYNSMSGTPYFCAILLGNATPVKCVIDANTYIDDGATPTILRAVEMTGNYDFSDVSIRNNRFSVLNATLSGLLYKELGKEVAPATLTGNVIHDLTGKTLADIDAIRTSTGFGVTATNATFHVAIPTALTNLIPLMTSNSLPGGAALASTEANSLNAAWCAMDRSTSTKWTASGATGTLQYDFGSGVLRKISQYTITGPVGGQETSAPKTWTLEGSLNGSSWTIIDTQTNAGTWTATEVRTYLVTNLNSYRYYRLNITLNQGGANLSLTEWQLQNNRTDVLAASPNRVDLGDATSSNVDIYSAPLVNFANGKVAMATSVVTKTAAYTIIITDSVILADATTAAFQITLPTAVGITGRQYTIKRINGGANNVTVGCAGAETIDGATTFVLTTQYQSITVVSNGSVWFVT